MTTLSDFLLARIEEDEAMAREPDGWNEYDEGDPGSPVRVLAECKAKRAIVERASELADHDDMGSSTRNDGDAILCALASVYADHPDFRAEWVS